MFTKFLPLTDPKDQSALQDHPYHMSAKDYSKATDGTRVISEDAWLQPFEGVLQHRYVT